MTLIQVAKFWWSSFASWFIDVNPDSTCIDKIAAAKSLTHRLCKETTIVEPLWCRTRPHLRKKDKRFLPWTLERTHRCFWPLLSHFMSRCRCPDLANLAARNSWTRIWDWFCLHWWHLHTLITGSTNCHSFNLRPWLSCTIRKVPFSLQIMTLHGHLSRTLAWNPGRASAPRREENFALRSHWVKPPWLSVAEEVKAC